MHPATPPGSKLQMFRRCLVELLISFVLGTVPVLVHSESAKSLREILGVLLASEFFLYYFASLAAAFAIAALVYGRMNFREGRHQRWLISFHRLLGDVGSSFLGAIRTGAGAVIGFLIMWHTLEPETISASNVIKVIGSAVVLIILSAGLALGEEILKNPRARR